MSERRYREGLEGIPGHMAAGRLLRKHQGEHRSAWNALEIFGLETAYDYMLGQAKAALRKPDEEGRIDGILEVATMFALTAVMADRERRREEDEYQMRVQRLREEQQSGDDPAAGQG